ncbi:MAG: type II toxin-antitoxin system VapC family toxin [Ignavibacteria bacterium]
MIVIDTNVIVSFWLPGDLTGNAERLINKDPEWIVPVLWRSEFRSVLSLYLRKKLLTLEKILNIIEEAEEHLKDNEFYVPSSDIMELVNSSNCSAYDCEFVALARNFKTKLITTDKQILKEFPSITKSLKEF